MQIPVIFMCKPYAYFVHMHTPGGMNTIPDMHHISTLARERIMRTVSIFKNGDNRAIRLPRTLWRSAGTFSPTKDDLNCEQNLDAGHLYLLIHHARAA